MENLQKLTDTTIVIDNIRFNFIRNGNVTQLAFAEYHPKDRGYLDVIAPAGTIPEIFRPYSGTVLECIQAPNTGVWRIKIHADGSIVNLYRAGGETIIYNNNIENSMFTYINNVR